MERFLFLLSLLLLPNVAWAKPDKQEFEGLLNKLLAPGPVIESHEDLEHKDCLKCHEAGGGVPDSGCLDCHKDISTQKREKKSFHGLMRGKDCIDCHKEHKGRNYDSTFVNKKTFNHADTGFRLDGSHAKLDCAKCHTSKRSDRGVRTSDPLFFGTKNSCKSCHAKDDIHKFTSAKFLQKECSTCHNTTKWKQAKFFDHRRETGYALEGSHAKLTCDKCHLPDKNRNPVYDFPINTKACLSCHEDHHGNNLSPKFQNGRCDTCHNQIKWDIKVFNHSMTGFDLKGEHKTLACSSCHKGNTSQPNFPWKGLNSDCKSCHADYHGYGTEVNSKLGALQNCETCHNETTWKQVFRFNHNTDTLFPITGKHKKNKCFDCHKTLTKSSTGRNALRDYHFPELEMKSCETCHKSPHTKQFKKMFQGVQCEECHSTEGWNIQDSFMAGKGKSFHNKTRFPLTGEHTKLKCAECHVKNKKEVYSFPNADKNFCVTCHESVHKNQFYPKTQAVACSECHTTVNFSKLGGFDHKKTGFPLTGEHAKLKECSECHVATKSMLPTKPPKPAHKFMLSHREEGFCEGCHKNVHEKQFHPEFSNKPCYECHNTTTFEERRPFEHDKTQFKLTGAHAKLERKCSECHVDTKTMLQTKPPKVAHKFLFDDKENGFCSDCHKNEHKDMFHPKFFNKPCVSCHTTTEFTKRKPFKHADTDFKLKGKHLKVKCDECHVNTQKRYSYNTKRVKGKYLFPEMPSKDCATCHKDPHKGSFGKECSSCHTELGWRKADDFHKDFTLEGVHLFLSCEECHVNDKTLSGSSQDCLACHADEEPHHKTLFPCQDCHTQSFWHNTTFDHNRTLFPLQGAHRLLECNSCHNSGLYEGTPTECLACHFKDAQGVGTHFQNNAHNPDRVLCEQCHNQFSF
ncbi:MAG: cytochrome c3 family protein [Oligoflexales bacterium]